MATKNFTEFDLRTDQNLSLNDFLVGYKSDGSTELRTAVKSLTATLGSTLRGATGATGPVGLPGATGFDFNYVPVTTNINLQTNTGYIVNTTLNGALTGTLPTSPSVGHFVNFTVTTNGVPPFTIARNSQNINSVAENLICDVTGNFSLVYTDASVGWKFIPFAGITSPSLKCFKTILSANNFNQTGIPGVSGLQNIENNERVPFNLVDFNTDTATFGGLENPSSKTLVSVHIKTPGYYNVSTNLHLLDLADGRHVFVQLWQYNATTGEEMLRAIADFTNFSGIGIDQYIYGNTTVHIPLPDTFLFLKLSHNIPFPGPYPSLTDSRNGGIDIGTKGPCELVITKLG